MSTEPSTPRAIGDLALILAALGSCALTVIWLYVRSGILQLLLPEVGQDWFAADWALALAAYVGLVVVACAIPIVSLATRSSSFAGWLTVQLIAGATAVLFGAWMFFLSMMGGLERPPFEPRPWRDAAIFAMPLVAIAPPVVMGIVMNRGSRRFDDDEPWLGRSLALASALAVVAIVLAVALRVFRFLDASR